MKRCFFQAAVVSILLYGCTTWMLTKRLEKKLDGNYTRMLLSILNKSWRQHPTKLQLYSHLHRNDDIYINIIIIMLHHQHGYPWPSLTTPPYRPLLLAGPQGYIPYRHRAAVCKFELVILPLLGHEKGSTRIHHLWARPYFSCSVPHFWFI